MRVAPGGSSTQPPTLTLFQGNPMSYYRNDFVVIYNRDSRDMAELSDESVQCVVT